MEIYTVKDFNKVFDDILNGTNNYENNEFKKLVVSMFSKFKIDEFDDVVIVNTPENVDIKMERNLYATYKIIRDILIDKKIIKSEFNSIKNIHKYEKNFYKSFDIYVNQSKNSINSKLEEELI